MIFTITAYTASGNSKRTWGWYNEFEEAERHVLQGDDLLLEGGTFHLLIIEEVPIGCPTLAERQWWYRADYISWYEDGKPNGDYRVEACPAPSWAQNVTNFSMG